MAAPSTIEQKEVIARLSRAVADARISGEEPSAYFLDKCDAEAGQCPPTTSTLKQAAPTSTAQQKGPP